MFSLVPWRKKNGRSIKVRRDQQEEYAYPLAEFRQELDSLFDRFFGPSRFSPLARLGQWEEMLPAFTWNADLSDEGNEYVFRAEAPGFEPDDFDIKVSGNLLIVHAEHKEEKKRKKEMTYHYGEFHQTFTLPQGVDTGKIDARYHSGVLEIHLPKSEEVHPKRIEVKAS